MLKKATLVLAIMAVLLFSKIQGNPVNGTEDIEDNPEVWAGSRLKPKISEWVKPDAKWSFPSISSITSLFDDQDAITYVNERIDIIQNTQKEILDALKQLAKHIASLSAALEITNSADTKKPENPFSPVQSVDNETETSVVNETVTIPVHSIVEMDQGPTEEKSEVTIKPVDIEKPLPQIHVKPNSTRDEIIEDNKPEVAVSEE